MSDLYIIPYDRIAHIEWAGSSLSYDIKLYRLARSGKRSVALNPWTKYKNDFQFIGIIPISHECLVYSYKGDWVAKVFPEKWDRKSYREITIEKPNLIWERNSDIPEDIYFEIPEYDLDFVDLGHEMIWYVDPIFVDGKSSSWVYKCYAEDSSIKGFRNMGSLSPSLELNLDVVFISYNEPNAEENWQRVLEKAPHALRVDGVDGIFEAHQAAAKIATTDMFYVVDGDAYLADDWEFDAVPNVWERNCAFLWASENPVNGLCYGNGGVKLFPRKALLSAKEWTSLDMFTGIMVETRYIDRVSCINTFNSDPFRTWRSAFRESVKLYNTNQMSALHTWETVGGDQPFGKYAMAGAQAGYKYAVNCKDNPSELSRINNYTWLKKAFDDSGIQD